MSTILPRAAAVAHAPPARRRRAGLAGPTARLGGVVLGYLVSFEMVVALYLYSNVFQVLLPPLPFDTTVIFFLLSVAVGGLVILREGIYLRGLYLVLAFVPYLLWACLSLAWTPSRVLVYENLKLLLTVDLWLLIAGAMVLAHKRERTRRLLVLSALLSLVVAAIGIAIYALYGSFKFADWEVGRVYNEWGRAVANGAIVLLVLFLRSRFASPRQLLLAGLLGACVLFILLSSSRSSLLVLAVPTLLFMAVHLAPAGRQGLALSRAQILLLLAVGAVATGVVALVSSGYKVDTIGRFMKVFAQAEDTDMLLAANRFDYYADAVEFFFQSPLIGHGVRSFSVLDRGFEATGVHAHNIFLELLADTGLVGLAAFLFLLLAAVRPLRAARLRADPVLLCVAMLFVGRFVAALLGNDLANQPVLFLAIGMLALRPPPAPAAADDDGIEEGEGEGEAAAEGEGWRDDALGPAREGPRPVPPGRGLG